MKKLTASQLKTYKELATKLDNERADVDAVFEEFNSDVAALWEKNVAPKIEALNVSLNAAPRLA